MARERRPLPVIVAWWMQAAIRKWIAKFASDRDFPAALKPAFHARKAPSAEADAVSPPHAHRGSVVKDGA